MQAQALYLQTRMGRTTTNLLVSLQENLQSNHPERWQTDLAAAYMAATYQLLKMETDAQQLAGRYRMGADRNEAWDDFNCTCSAGISSPGPGKSAAMLSDA